MVTTDSVKGMYNGFVLNVTMFERRGTLKVNKIVFT